MLRTAEFAGQIAKKERILGQEVIQDLSGTTVRIRDVPDSFGTVGNYDIRSVFPIAQQRNPHPVERKSRLHV